jgi:ring-1,2-phenylacetyl-CoA epoxidase subunit PaaD
MVMQSEEAHIIDRPLEKRVWNVLATVNDPEIPVLSILDLGIVRAVDVIPSSEAGKERIIITITPTYSGCPAMDMIAMNIGLALKQAGFMNFDIKTTLSPAWTTDWMTEAGKQKLKAYGIAPPNPTHSVCSLEMFAQDEAIQCPRCNSYKTKMISRFGSTACKALYQCSDCLEPFDYFKCH